MKNKIVLFIFISILISWKIQLFAQCYTGQNHINLKSAVCDDWNIYNPVNPANTPIKNVRITFHIMQKTDGTGNFPDNAASRNYLQTTFINLLNAKFSNTSQMNLSTNSPFIQDIRIRFTLANIYFWQTDYGWNFQQTSEYGDNLYATYVTNQPNVQFKNNSVHVFMGENSVNKGIAVDIGAREWSAVSGIYTMFLQNNSWSIANLLAHELGHNLGLWHTWNQNDACNDTPMNPGCWNVNEPVGCSPLSNNMMDYNASQSALTICQVNRMHYHLNGNGTIADCLINSPTVQSPVITGSELICPQGVSYTLSNLQFGVGVQWSTNPSNFFTSNSGCGNNINLVPQNSSTGANQLNVLLDFDRYSTISGSKNLWVGKPQQLELCSIVPNVFNATLINAPGSSCSSLKILSGRNIEFIGNEIILKSGFEVEQGGSLTISSLGGCN